MSAESRGVEQVRTELYRPTVEGEARVLMLIAGFTSATRGLEGRTKLAKLDFLLRYPNFFERALARRAPQASYQASADEQNSVEAGMIRYRYGPWDPAYFAILGRLVGKQLVIPGPGSRGVEYRASDLGLRVAHELAGADAWKDVALRVSLLKRHFNLTGSRLKDLVYETFPEVTNAAWGEEL